MITAAVTCNRYADNYNTLEKGMSTLKGDEHANQEVP